MGKKIYRLTGRPFPRPPLLFSSDPHELASWVKKIYRLAGHGSPGLPPLPHSPLPPPPAAEAGMGEGKLPALPGSSSTV